MQVLHCDRWKHDNFKQTQTPRQQTTAYRGRSLVDSVNNNEASAGSALNTGKIALRFSARCSFSGLPDKSTSTSFVNKGMPIINPSSSNDFREMRLNDKLDKGAFSNKGNKAAKQQSFCVLKPF